MGDTLVQKKAPIGAMKGADSKEKPKRLGVISLCASVGIDAALSTSFFFAGPPTIEGKIEQQFQNTKAASAKVALDMVRTKTKVLTFWLPGGRGAVKRFTEDCKHFENQHLDANRYSVAATVRLADPNGPKWTSL